ncbi:TolC family protein [Frigoriglobus tundricola]|uniref:Outer membrane efflux protein n=1 Tax=Frigoriglobus tundricola TaxID=2774151 RepID=A0A6M5YJ91_9BACT|nr:TolC family protein [Frigoriglobus tundricola]QJW93624.1 hypothetical protein FTUN_1132 [Frigoriglobus tundricola]
MSRSRWIKRVLAGALTLSATGGCKQPLFTEPSDYHDAVKVPLPKSLETDAHAPITPSPVNKMAAIQTVTDFVRPPRNMSLRECVAIALEQGNTGFQSAQGNNFGIKIDNPPTLSGGRTVLGTDAIRAYALDPAIAQPEVERSLSRFDARWVTSMQWQKIDAPTPAGFLSFQNQQDNAQLSSTLAKPLPTGGVAGITFSTTYAKYPAQAAAQSNLVNPNYIPTMTLTLEQPLLKLFGVEINQISNQIPLQNGSILLPGLTSISGNGTEGILITRLRVDQAKSNFESLVNYMLVNVEAAYWNLYSAYYNLYANEEGLRQAYEGYRFIKLRVEIGTDPPQRLDQTQAQFHRFQRQVYQARAQVLENERQLRGLLGLRSDDGFRIVPIDEPNLAPYLPDFHEAANDAIALRPELMVARQDLKFQQLNVLLQKNLRRPDLRGYGSYNISGLGTGLGGSTTDVTAAGNTIPGNALTNFAQNRYNSWTIGLRYDVPLGYRDASGLVREAQLNLTRSYVQLRDAELKTIEFLALQYRRVIETYIEIGPARAERESLQAYVARIRERIRIGAYSPDEFLNLLTVQQQLATAVATEAQTISNYNIALAAFEFAKGTVQQYNNIAINEGPLPPWVEKRAKDHFKERTEAAFKLRERPAPTDTSANGSAPLAPAGGTGTLLNLPPFAEKQDPLPDSLPPRPGAAEPRTPPGGTRPTPGTSDAPVVPAPGPGRLVAAATGRRGNDSFTPEGRVTFPPAPQSGRTMGAVTAPPAPLTGTARTPDDYFKQTDRVTIPQPPDRPTGSTATTPPVGVPGSPTTKPDQFFEPIDRVTLPQPPKRTGDPVWAPTGQPVPAPAPAPIPVPPQAGFDVQPPPVVAPLPPITLPPLPPVSGTPGGQ